MNEVVVVAARSDALDLVQPNQMAHLSDVSLLKCSFWEEEYMCSLICEAMLDHDSNNTQLPKR